MANIFRDSMSGYRAWSIHKLMHKYRPTQDTDIHLPWPKIELRSAVLGNRQVRQCPGWSNNLSISALEIK